MLINHSHVEIGNCKLELTKENSMKCVMIVNESLPLGLIANTTAVLAMSIGKTYGHLVGRDVQDQLGGNHPGITQIPISILRGNDKIIMGIRQKLQTNGIKDVYMVDFCDVAQKSKKYDEYEQKMNRTPPDQMSYLGLGLYGPKNLITNLTGNMPLLK